MKPELVVFFVIGYLVFCFIMEAFGISDLFKEYLKDENEAFYNNNNDKSTKNIKGIDNKDDLTIGTILKPDDVSTPLKLSKEELGRHTWALIHSIAASYPLEPDAEHRQALIKFVDSLKLLYPCEQCRKHFSTMMEKLRIPTDNRNKVVKFFCEVHNIVNKRIKKPEFQCKKAVEYWGGDCGCDTPE